MSTDNRRYKSRSPRNTEKPMKRDREPTMARDGFTVLRSETFERNETPYRWNEERNVSPNLKDDDECRFDSYMMD